MRKLTEQIAKAAVIGGVAGMMDTAAVTTWLHRSYTHKSLKLTPSLETTARAVTWASGTRPREWAAIHRLHHEHADTPADPHSPVQLGRWGVAKLYLRNTPNFNKNAKEITRKGEFPPDLQPDNLDKLIFDKKKTGLLVSLAAHMAINRTVGNPWYMGGLSWAIEKGVYVNGGNLVNAIGHSGKNPGKALLTGVIEPHEDGSFGADSKWVAAVTLGEGNQNYHHRHPEEIYFGPNANDLSLIDRAQHDLGGTVALSLVEYGLATVGEKPEPVFTT